MRRAAGILLPFVLGGCAGAGAAGGAGRAVPERAATAAATVPAITTADLERRERLLADDSMMGRESGSRGDYEAAAYVAAEFRRLGLEPAGENGSYFQTVPLWLLSPDPRSLLDVDGETLRIGSDFMPLPGAPTRALAGVQVVYGGPIDDTTRWIATDGGDKRLVVLGVPPGTPLRGMPQSAAHWHTAAAVAVATLDQLPPEILARFMTGRPVPDSVNDPRMLPILLVTQRAARVLLGADASDLAPGAPGRIVRGGFGYLHTPVAYAARNVIGVLRGSDRALAGEYVAVSAHNDHVGFDHSPVDHDSLRAFNRVVRPMGADSPPRPATPEEWTRIRVILDSLRQVHRPRLDSIRNGADDDASGTASILEVAEAMAARHPRPRRSILFISHTAEEAGLLGSRWFTDHPTVPLDSVIGEIDQDMVGRGKSSDVPVIGKHGGPTYLETIGAYRMSKAFGAALDSANARQPLPFVFNLQYDQPGDPLNYFCRNDAYSYARFGIPTVSISRGEHLDYHQVTDEAQYIDYPDMARVAHLVLDMATMLADAPTRPALDHPKPADPNGPCRQ